MEQNPKTIKKVKVQNSVELKYKFYKVILKASSFWRGFSRSIKLNRSYTSDENSRSSLLPLISQILMHSDVQICRYFSKVAWPHLDDILASGERCHLDFSPKSYTYPTFGDHGPSRSEDNFSFILWK